MEGRYTAEILNVSWPSRGNHFPAEAAIIIIIMLAWTWHFSSLQHRGWNSLLMAVAWQWAAEQRRGWGQRSVLLWRNSRSSQGGEWLWGSSIGRVMSRELRYCFYRRNVPESSHGLSCVQATRQKDHAKLLDLNKQNPTSQGPQESQEI